MRASSNSRRSNHPPIPSQPFQPNADNATFRDLLIFEERLKQNAARMAKRKSKYQRLLVLLIAAIVFLSYFVFLNKSTYLPLHYLNLCALLLCSTTLFLFFASGMYEERIMAANKFVPQANRSLRSYNMFLNVKTSPRRSFIYRIPLVSRIFRNPHRGDGEDQSPEKSRIKENVLINSSSNGKNISIPPRSSSSPENSNQATNSTRVPINPSSPIPNSRATIAPIPPSKNPRGELIFSSKVAPEFREGYEKYRSAFERRREERRLMENQKKWKFLPRFLTWGRESRNPLDGKGGSGTSGGAKVRTGTKRIVGDGQRERTNSGTRTTRKMVNHSSGFNPPPSASAYGTTSKRPQVRNRSASQTSVNSIASSSSSQQSQNSIATASGSGGVSQSQSEASGGSASEEEEVEELDDLNSEPSDQTFMNQSNSRRYLGQLSSNSRENPQSHPVDPSSNSTRLAQEGLRVDTTSGRRKNDPLDLNQETDESERRGRERGSSRKTLFDSETNPSLTSGSGSTLGRRTSSRANSFKGAKNQPGNQVEEVRSGSASASTPATAGKGNGNGLIPVAGSSHDPNPIAVAVTSDDRSDAELTLREPEAEPELEPEPELELELQPELQVESEAERKEEDRKRQDVGIMNRKDTVKEEEIENQDNKEEWIQVRRSGRRSANHSSTSVP